MTGVGVIVQQLVVTRGSPEFLLGALVLFVLDPLVVERLLTVEIL